LYRKKYSNEELDFHGRQCLGVKRNPTQMEIFFLIQTKSFFEKRPYNKWKPLGELKNCVKLRGQIFQLD